MKFQNLFSISKFKEIIFFTVLLGAVNIGYAQIEKYPVFDECSSLSVQQLEYCFSSTLENKVKELLVFPEKLLNEHYNSTINILLIVDRKGTFKVLDVNSPYKEFKTEVERVFKHLPNVEPALFNNRPIEMRFVLPLKVTTTQEEVVTEKKVDIQEKALNKIQTSKPSTKYPELQSHLNIPFTHQRYFEYESALASQENSHTAVKPYSYATITKIVDVEKNYENVAKSSKTWFSRKLFNEHMVTVVEDDFWFTINPGIDLQVGRDNFDVNTFNNTRSIHVNGGIGKKFSFSTNFYESQGRFAQYINQYANYLKPAGGNPGIVPGRGLAKEFKTDAFDYPVAEAYIAYAPNDIFRFQFGNGKNFIGDGYRSLFLSDVASPYPYLKIETSFWKIQYTNLWMWLQDVRPELTVDGAYRQKFMATHYLSWNATKKLNIGFFETVIWEDSNDRGFDVNYINPIIFLTSAEFSTGSRAGNTLLGLSFKYKLKSAALYSQFIIDEFRASEITSPEGWWGNKYGFQIGAKYFNAFKVKNLTLQLEYNTIKPYTYSHDELNYNYGHNNQSLAHLWGANFREFITIANYTKDRWFANAKLIYGKKGFDFTNDAISYGGNIYFDNDLRVSDYDISTLQGNEATITIADLQVGYTVNPSTNLKLFAGVTIRNFDSKQPTPEFLPTNTTWFSVGLRTSMFNWYFDF